MLSRLLKNNNGNRSMLFLITFFHQQIKQNTSQNFIKQPQRWYTCGCKKYLGNLANNRNLPKPPIEPRPIHGGIIAVGTRNVETHSANAARVHHAHVYEFETLIEPETIVCTVSPGGSESNMHKMDRKRNKIHCKYHSRARLSTRKIFLFFLIV